MGHHEWTLASWVFKREDILTYGFRIKTIGVMLNGGCVGAQETDDVYHSRVFQDGTLISRYITSAVPLLHTVIFLSPRPPPSRNLVPLHHLSAQLKIKINPRTQDSSLHTKHRGSHPVGGLFMRFHHGLMF
jgi:hypothetical protein